MTKPCHFEDRPLSSWIVCAVYHSLPYGKATSASNVMLGMSLFCLFCVSQSPSCSCASPLFSSIHGTFIPEHDCALAYFIATMQNSAITNQSGITFGLSLCCVLCFGFSLCLPDPIVKPHLLPLFLQHTWEF